MNLSCYIDIPGSANTQRINMHCPARILGGVRLRNAFLPGKGPHEVSVGMAFLLWRERELVGVGERELVGVGGRVHEYYDSSLSIAMTMATGNTSPGSIDGAWLQLNFDIRIWSACSRVVMLLIVHTFSVAQA